MSRGAPNVGGGAKGSVVLGAILGFGCSAVDAGSEPQDGRVAQTVREDGVAKALDELRSWETTRRAKTDFSSLPTSDRVLGPEPYALRALADGRLVGILRGADRLVLLDADMSVVSSIETPAGPTSLDVLGSDIVVGSERLPVVGRYRLEDRGFVRRADWHVPGAGNTRAVTFTPQGRVIVADEIRHRLWTVTAPEGAEVEVSPPIDGGLGPVRLERVGRSLLTLSILDQSVWIRALGTDGRPEPTVQRIHHDGPAWGMSGLEIDGALWIAVGGVEDHALDRTGGFFGYVDSYVYLYRATPGDTPARMAMVNVGEHGVITPKALVLRETGDSLEVSVWGYGSEVALDLSWPKDGLTTDTTPRVRPRSSVPGSNAVVVLESGATVHANPLLDAWVVESGTTTAVHAVESGASVPSRSLDSKLGEALFFTGLMAPHAKSDDALSRFTCETCHFEGYVDGRTHHTGRGEVHATTKPLVGLFNNGPHFSRALDEDLTEMVHAEFRVAGAKSGHDPWFSHTVGDRSFLVHLGFEPGDELEPARLRRALMTFLMEFTHRPNPATVDRRGFSDRERRGAELFRDRCEGCHAARLESRDPKTRVPYERWEDMVFQPEGAIVWGRIGYEKTGVEPYVHRAGARVPSLRRLYKKRPYFTNGSAADLDEVLERAFWNEGRFFHDGPPGGIRLDAESRASLKAFLELL